MVEITAKQLLLIEKSWLVPNLPSFSLRLRREFPEETKALSKEQLTSQIEEVAKAAPFLEINEIEHIYRLVRLRYLPSASLKRSGAQRLLLRVLTDISVDIETRLRFLERNYMI